MIYHFWSGNPVFLFPACQMRVVGFYVSSCPPSFPPRPVTRHTPDLNRKSRISAGCRVPTTNLENMPKNGKEMLCQRNCHKEYQMTPTDSPPEVRQNIYIYIYIYMSITISVSISISTCVPSLSLSLFLPLSLCLCLYIYIIECQHIFTIGWLPSCVRIAKMYDKHPTLNACQAQAKPRVVEQTASARTRVLFTVQLKAMRS